MCYYQVFVCYNETTMGFQGGMVVENAPTNAGDAALIPGSIRTPVEGNGNPPQYSCLENPMGRGVWWAAVHEVTKSQTRLSDSTTTTLRH